MQLLEATREVLEHLSRWKIQLNERGQESPQGLVHTYGRVRRLKDYLQRCVAAYPNPIELDLNEDDENLVVSCAVHDLGAIDFKLQSPVDSQARAWLEERRRNLSACAVQLATRPVERLPAPDSVSTNTPTVRAVVGAVLRNVAAKNTSSAGMAPFFGHRDPPDEGTTNGAGQPEQAAAPPSDSSRPWSLMAGPRAAEPPPAPTPAEPPATPPRGDAPHPARTPPPRSSPAAATLRPNTRAVQEPRAVGPGFAPMDADFQAEHPEPAVSEGPKHLLDPRRIRDPRLRGMAFLDLRALDRSQAARDYRLAMVHLASVLEGVVTDFAIPRLKQLGIKGPPEAWKIEEIVTRVMGERISAMERAYLFQLIASRNLVRPLIQLHAPMVVTATTLEQATQFVRRVLAELGFTGTGELPPEPAVRPVDPVRS